DRQRGAGGDADATADDPVGAEDPGLHVGDVHRAALAFAVAARLAEELGHHQVDPAALGDAVAVAAVGRGDVVVGSECRAGTDPASFFADVSVGRTAD